MLSKIDFIRRFATEANHVARLVSFNIEVDIDLTEDEIVEQLQVRGYGVHAV